MKENDPVFANCPPSILRVCKELFSGDMDSMIHYAKEYAAGSRKDLGRTFREIIGTRNREKFWNRVRELEMNQDPDCVVINGDSLADWSRALDQCKKGRKIKVQIGGRIIGTLVPEVIYRKDFQ